MSRLLRSIDELQGRRAARWIRESTAGQFDNFGPASQRERQDVAIERYGLVDTGLEWSLSHSGRTVHASREMAELVAAARAGEFDVLVVGYADRWQRNLRWTLQVLEDDLHPAGVAVLFADRRILSSDPRDWDELVAEATAAERYSRRLAERITDGYAAKFRSRADQAGNAPLGFRRRPDPPRVLEIDPATIGQVVTVFTAYAAGNVSTADLAAHVGLGEEQVRKMLRNPLYNGWVRRHRGHDEERAPAAWRADPPVSDALWSQVQDVRASKTRGGGPRRPNRADPLLGLLWCVCGRRIRGDGMMGSGASQRRARMHSDPCADWGDQARYSADTWEGPIAAQISGLRLDERTIAAVRSAIEAPAPIPMATSPARFARSRRDLADDVAAERIGEAAYLEAIARLRVQEAEARHATAPSVDADRAVAWLRDLAALWKRATPEEQAELIRAIYARIEIAGRRFVAVTLTPDAYAHGLPAALPPSVHWLGKRPRMEMGTRSRSVDIPILGRDLWLRAAKVSA